MTYSRVLGTIGLIGATVLGATGQLHAPQPAQASPAFASLNPAAAKAALRTTLGTGVFTTVRGKKIYLSNTLVNSHFGLHGKSKSASSNSTHVGSNSVAVPSNPPSQATAPTRANQDFGYYQTGNGQLFHNTEAVAVDPMSALHVVVTATDTRLGSDGSIFNTFSNPTENTGQSQNGGGSACFTSEESPTVIPCFLTEALGGPGVYNSVDAGANWTDQIIPDMLTGAVPNALENQERLVAPGSVSANVDFTTPITCLSADTNFNGPSQNFGFGLAGRPNGCLPYDSAGDNSAAFDASGNLYVASLGLVNSVPPEEVTAQSGLPQTDVVVNVSPAVQPSTAAIGAASTPDAAGRFFSAPPQSLECNVAVVGTNICLHGEVTASTQVTNFFPLGSADYNGSSVLPGRNYPADAGLHFSGVSDDRGPDPGCGFDNVCLIDAPYLSIDNGTDPNALLTYQLYDFTQGTSNIELQVAHIVAGNAGQGDLPFWSQPVNVDNPNATDYGFSNTGGADPGAGTNGNIFCPGSNGASTTPPFGFCAQSWGAEPTIGPDGLGYIVYENMDFVDNTNNSTGAERSAILVATVASNGTQATVLATSFVAEALDHDQYESSFTNSQCQSGGLCDPAALDPASNAFFTIPNRPTIAVTGPATVNGVYFGSGIVVVAWTDQRSLAGGITANGDVAGNSGTRIWYALGAPKNRCSTADGCLQSQSQFVHFDLLSRGFNLENSLSVQLPTAAPDTIGGSYFIAEVDEPFTFVNQFFPWLAASQQNFNKLVNDNIFVGYYVEVPMVPGVANGPNAHGPVNGYLQYRIAKSSDWGDTFGVSTITPNNPLPQVPLSSDACIAAGYNSDSYPVLALALCNATPYFGTYTGMASDLSNGAYGAWTDTRPTTRNFNVGGSQDVYAVHVN